MKTSHQLGLGVGVLAVATGLFGLLAAMHARNLQSEADQLRLTGLAREIAHTQLAQGAAKLEFTLSSMFDARLDRPEQPPNWARLDPIIQDLQGAHLAANNVTANRGLLDEPTYTDTEKQLRLDEQAQTNLIAQALRDLEEAVKPARAPKASRAVAEQALDQAITISQTRLLPAIKHQRGLVQQLQQAQFFNLGDSAESLLRIALLAGIVTLGIAILLVAVMYRQLVAPLLRFESTARAISAGQSDVRIGVGYKEHNEFGILAAAFDDMLDTLESTTVSRRELEKLVADRTQAFHESEERIRDLFNNTTDLIQSIGPDGSFLYVNPAWQKTLGYTDAELPGLKFIDIIAPEHQAHCTSVFQRLMAGETLGLQALNFLTKDGQILPVEGHVSCRLEPGRPALTRGIFRDITIRRLHEDATHRQMEFLESLNQTTLDLFGQHQLPELLTTITERAARLIDTPYAEIALLEGNDFVVRSVYGPAVCAVGERTPRDQAILSNRALGTGEPVCIENFSEFEGGRALYKRWGFHAVAVFPILRGTERLGVIGLLRDRPGHTFSTSDLQKGQVFAQLTALVLHNTAAHEKALRDITERKA